MFLLAEVKGSVYVAPGKQSDAFRFSRHISRAILPDALSALRGIDAFVSQLLAIFHPQLNAKETFDKFLEQFETK